MGKHILGFEKGIMKVKEDGEVRYGVAVWCAGIKLVVLLRDWMLGRVMGGWRG
jgi:NADH:ubiquinone reductase (non-electrogenic)